VKKEEGITTKIENLTEYILASDFDQTLSFNDSGYVLCEILGIDGFGEKVAGLSRSNLVHQGAELSYLLRHDPQFRSVRREHLIEAGRRVRLKDDVQLMTELLKRDFDGNRFRFYVISAAPREVVQSALAGIVPPENIFGTEIDYDPDSGEISNIVRVPAGYGKVVVLQELELQLQISPDRTIYVGDGSSDLYVMHHVNSRDGHTIAVSETKAIGRIAKRTVLSANALGVLVPVLEDILKWNAHQVREFFASFGLGLQDWDKIRTDWLTFQKAPLRFVAKETVTIAQ
jgi:phosphoserine phosphatase